VDKGRHLQFMGKGPRGVGGSPPPAPRARNYVPVGSCATTTARWYKRTSGVTAKRSP